MGMKEQKCVCVCGFPLQRTTDGVVNEKDAALTLSVCVCLRQGETVMMLSSDFVTVFYQTLP